MLSADRGFLTHDYLGGAADFLFGRGELGVSEFVLGLGSAGGRGWVKCLDWGEVEGGWRTYVVDALTVVQGAGIPAVGWRVLEAVRARWNGRKGVGVQLPKAT
jgi:hypothetical protein